MGVGNISLKLSNAFTIKWNIPDYFSHPSYKGYFLDSPSFNYKKATWTVRLYPNGPIYYDDMTVFSLIRLQSLIPCHKINYTFNIMANDEILYPERFAKFHFNKNCEALNESVNIPGRYILSNMKKEIAPNGTLTVMCHVIHEELAEESVNYQNMPQVTNRNTLAEDMRNLLFNGQNHDLILKVNDEEFYAHQNIMMARSSTFESMLSHKMRNNSVIDVSDCDPKAVKQFLLYVYCDEVEDLNRDVMLGLYYMSDKYNLKSLKKECQDFIKKSLDVSNIYDVIQLAINHSDKDLLESATAFFVKNSNEILQTTEWMSFFKENSTIANELLIKASQKRTGEISKLKKRKKK